MDNNGKIAATGGMSVGTVLLIIFICGKLFNFGPFASWSWLKIILVPILVNLGIIFIILIITVVMLFILFLNKDK